MKLNDNAGLWLAWVFSLLVIINFVAIQPYYRGEVREVWEQILIEAGREECIEIGDKLGSACEGVTRHAYQQALATQKVAKAFNRFTLSPWIGWPIVFVTSLVTLLFFGNYLLRKFKFI